MCVCVCIQGDRLALTITLIKREKKISSAPAAHPPLQCRNLREKRGKKKSKQRKREGERWKVNRERTRDERWRDTERRTKIATDAEKQQENKVRECQTQRHSYLIGRRF